MKISEDVLTVLSTIECDGEAARIQRELARPLYLAVNKVLEAAGGKWNRKAKAHLFPVPASTALEPLILTGEVVDPRSDFDYFPTPALVIERMVEKLKPTLFDDVLEPSAGDGNIVRALAPLVRSLTAYELVPQLADKLKAIVGVTVHEADFLTAAPAPSFTAVVMNPPFGRRADIHHVRHAAKFLKPRGRLIAIMSAGVLFRDDNLTRDFRSFVTARDGSIERLPPDSFRSSGTSVNTCLVTLTA